MQTTLTDGTSTYEILSKEEVVVEFPDRDSAVRFLRGLAADPVVVQQLRSFLGRTHMNLHVLSDHQIIDMMAATIVDKNLKLLRLASATRSTARRSRLPEAAEVTIPAQQQQVAPASSSAATSAPPPANDVADVDQDAQAQALEEAAKDGVPFCEECEKLRQQKNQEAMAAA